MKAIVIAAGLGSRLGSLTRNTPKCRLKIRGKSMIDHQLGAFRSLGITDISIVTGYLGEQLVSPGVKIYRNEDYRNNNILFSLMMAESELNDDVIVSYSDILYEPQVLQRLVEAKGEFLLVCDSDWKQGYIGRKDHPVDQAEKVTIKNQQIVQLGKHLPEAVADAEFIGLARFSRSGCSLFKSVFSEIAKKYQGKPFQAAKEVKKSYLTDLFQELADRRHVLQPVLIQQGWKEIDTLEDFIKAGGEVPKEHQNMNRELMKSGQNFRSILNDLKRRPEDAARELGYSLAVIEDFLSGRKTIDADLVSKATSRWPISARDFYLLQDDCPRGIKIMRAADSQQSKRVMQRAGKDYYEYRDTAMSSLAQFRPEWIRELCLVSDNDPKNSALQWNNGHFLHQFTYFVGPVNFYYRGQDGSEQVAVMNTGDSMYISPFVPHTFATRKNEKGNWGHILALTYGNKLGGETQQELSACGEQLVEKLAYDLTTQTMAIASLLKFHRHALSLSVQELSRRSSQPVNDLLAFESGQKLPDLQALKSLAKTMNVSLKDLLPYDRTDAPVIVRYYSECSRWKIEGKDGNSAVYEMVELASSVSLPCSKSLEINLLANQSVSHTENFDLEVGLHQYGYNVGTSPVHFSWKIGSEIHQEVLQPDDSFYIKPGVAHCFRGLGGKVLVLRIGGRMAGEALLELSNIGKKHLPRILGESIQWFDPRGRREIKEDRIE